MLFALINYGQSFVPKVKNESLYKLVPVLNGNEPKWVKLLYDANPNYHRIADAYYTYYLNHNFEKTIHTQNLKFFLKNVHDNDYLLPNGEIHIPTLEEIRQRELFKEQNNTKQVSSNNWIPLGPFESFHGESTDTKTLQTNIYTLDQSISNPNVIYSGSETGGVFKSVDKGLNWVSVGDQIFYEGSIHVIEIDPNNENIVYVGANHHLYKTIDGGVNWTTVFNEGNFRPNAVKVNQNNSQIIFIASETGLRKSTDGGMNWTTIFNDKCWDIQFKTDDPNTVFVAKHNPLKNITEILKSTNGGLNFSVKNSGWFSPIGGAALSDGGARIAVTDADPNRIYVVLLGEENDNVEDYNYIGIYRSDDAAENWFTPYDGNNDGLPDNEPGGPYSNEHWCLSSAYLTGGYNQGFYNLDIAVSDNDPDDLLIGFLSLFKSEDGGVTYTEYGGYGCTGCGNEYRHPDIQEIEINNGDIWVASDGGIDLYNNNFDFVEPRINGINGSDYWGFDQGWNHDVFVGGRYHNGNAGYYEDYPLGDFTELGGVESPTGYVNKGQNRRVFHSDAGAVVLPTTITGEAKMIDGFSLYPNENYIFPLRSEVVNDPRYWNEIYIGKDNKLWKSINEGGTFSLVKEFGPDPLNIVKHIEVSRLDPNIIFVTQKNNSSGLLWKSLDGGETWSSISIPTNHESMFISLSEDNNYLYLALNNGWWDDKVFVSNDLGDNWVNLTTSTLDGERIENIQIQDGTNGGVYLTSNKTIWYRNNTHTDWIVYSNELPKHFRICKILPFYRDGKLRVAGNRGVWETNLFESSLPKAQPMVSNKTINCSRMVVQFEDFSILNHSNASWEWQFPGASSVSSYTIRNPQVTYDSQGMYDVTLKVTDGNGNSSIKTVTNMIEIGENLCSPEPDPRQALACTNGGDFAFNTTFDITGIANFSFTGWIKPNGIQADYSGIFSLSDGCVLNFREGNNTLGIHWKGGTYWGLDSNLEVPENEWSYVAITVTPTQITLYLNEDSHTWDLNTDPFDLYMMNLGTYNQWIERQYNGLMDEFTFWSRTLNEDEIRLARHLTKSDVSDPDIIAYYQFNHQLTNKVFDKKGFNDLTLHYNATLVNSDAPIGPGTSSFASINSAGNYNFIEEGIQLDFSNSGSLPNGDIVVSRIGISPSVAPSTNIIESNYWIMNNYGTNNSFNALSGVTLSDIQNIDQFSSADLNLYKRFENSDSTINWNNIIPNNESTIFNINNQSVKFLETGAFISDGQLFLGSINPAIEPPPPPQDDTFVIYPNPVKKGGDLIFQGVVGNAQFVLFSIDGKAIGTFNINEENNTVKIPQIANGVYPYYLETSDKIINGKIIIQ